MSQDSQTSARGCRRPVLAVLLLFFLLFLVVVGITLYRSWSGPRTSANQELERIRKRGEPATAQELEQWYGLQPGANDITHLWLDGSMTFGTKHFYQDAKPFPIIGASELTIPPPNQPWDQLDAVKQLLNKYQLSMQTLHEAAVTEGEVHYPTGFSEGPAQLLPFVQNLRGAARMLRIEANARAHSGDAHGAAQDIHTTLKMSHSLSTYPGLVAQLVRIAIAGIAHQTLQELMPYVQFSDEDLLLILTTIQQQQSNDGLYRAFIGERVSGLVALNNPRMMEYIEPGTHGRNIAVFRASNRAFYLKYMGKFIEGLEVPWPEKVQVARSINEEARLAVESSFYARVKYAHGWMMLAATHVAVEAEGRAIASSNLVQTAIAIELYRRKHGQLPATLDDLVPDYLPSVLIDPFDGQPLKYIVEGDKYRVYSIGRRGVDDKGTGNLSGEPDIVFGIPEPKMEE